jgi:hypothetical protein
MASLPWFYVVYLGSEPLVRAVNEGYRAPDVSQRP